MAYEIVVDKETAQKEISAWLDYRRVRPGKREKMQKSIDVLTDALMYGDITIDDRTLAITQKLNIPVNKPDGSVAMDSLTYKPRLTVDEIEQCATDMNSSLAKGYGSALTGRPSTLIGGMDSSDASILSTICLFFTD